MFRSTFVNRLEKCLIESTKQIDWPEAEREKGTQKLIEHVGQNFDMYLCAIFGGVKMSGSEFTNPRRFVVVLRTLCRAPEILMGEENASRLAALIECLQFSRNELQGILIKEDEDPSGESLIQRSAEVALHYNSAVKNAARRIAMREAGCPPDIDMMMWELDHMPHQTLLIQNHWNLLRQRLKAAPAELETA